MECLTNEYLEALNTLGASGDATIDYIFQMCVAFLSDLAKLIGISYEEINIWIFIVIWPILTVYLIARNFFLKRKVKLLT
jgi:hypothetical protein